MPLWEDLTQPWQSCLEQAWDAFRAGSVPIGAVIVDADSAVISQGRNRIYEQQGTAGGLYGHNLAHAELNALIALPVSADRHACTLYTTMEPCPLCMGAIYMSGVRSVHYAARDSYAGSINLLGTTPYLSVKPIVVYGPHDALLEQVATAWHVVFALGQDGRERQAANQRVLAAWEQVVPGGVQLGRRLYQDGSLARLAQEDVPVSRALDWSVNNI